MAYYQYTYFIPGNFDPSAEASHCRNSGAHDSSGNYRGKEVTMGAGWFL